MTTTTGVKSKAHSCVISKSRGPYGEAKKRAADAWFYVYDDWNDIAQPFLEGKSQYRNLKFDALFSE